MTARKLLLGTALLTFGAFAPRVHAQNFTVEGQAGYFDMLNANDTLKAITGSSGGVTFGGTFTYILRKGFFFSAGGRYFAKKGERVFVADPSGEVFKLGHPLKTRVVPYELTLGFRFKGFGSSTLYTGLGPGLASFHQESTVGGLTETDNKTKLSGHVLFGVEFGRSRLRYGVEASYSIVPSTIGEDPGSVGKVYGETDIGGLVVLGRVVIRLSGK